MSLGVTTRKGEKNEKAGWQDDEWIEEEKSMTERRRNRIRTDEREEVGGADSARAGGRTVPSAGTSGTVLVSWHKVSSQMLNFHNLQCENS